MAFQMVFKLSCAVGMHLAGPVVCQPEKAVAFPHPSPQRPAAAGIVHRSVPLVALQVLLWIVPILSYQIDLAVDCLQTASDLFPDFMAHPLVLMVSNACSHIQTPTVLPERLSEEFLKNRLLVPVDDRPELFRIVVELRQGFHIEPAVEPSPPVAVVVFLFRSAFGCADEPWMIGSCMVDRYICDDSDSGGMEGFDHPCISFIPAQLRVYMEVIRTVIAMRRAAAADGIQVDCRHTEASQIVCLGGNTLEIPVEEVQTAAFLVWEGLIVPIHFPDPAAVELIFPFPCTELRIRPAEPVGENLIAHR